MVPRSPSRPFSRQQRYCQGKVCNLHGEDREVENPPMTRQYGSEPKILTEIGYNYYYFWSHWHGIFVWPSVATLIFLLCLFISSLASRSTMPKLEEQNSQARPWQHRLIHHLDTLVPEIIQRWKVLRRGGDLLFTERWMRGIPMQSICQKMFFCQKHHTHHQQGYYYHPHQETFVIGRGQNENSITIRFLQQKFKECCCVSWSLSRWFQEDNPFVPFHLHGISRITNHHQTLHQPYLSYHNHQNALRPLSYMESKVFAHFSAPPFPLPFRKSTEDQSNAITCWLTSINFFTQPYVGAVAKKAPLSISWRNSITVSPWHRPPSPSYSPWTDRHQPPNWPHNANDDNKHSIASICKWNSFNDSPNPKRKNHRGFSS